MQPSPRKKIDGEIYPSKQAERLFCVWHVSRGPVHVPFVFEFFCIDFVLNCALQLFVFIPGSFVDHHSCHPPPLAPLFRRFSAFLCTKNQRARPALPCSLSHLSAPYDPTHSRTQPRRGPATIKLVLLSSIPATHPSPVKESIIVSRALIRCCRA